MKTSNIFLLFFLLSSVLKGQEQGWSFGAWSFIGPSKFTQSDAPSKYENQLAFQVGGLAQYQTKGRTSIRLGLGYSDARGGYKGEEPDIVFPGFPPLKGDTYEVKFERSDVVLPIDLVIDLGRTHASGLYLQLGTGIDLKLHRKADKTIYSSGISTTSSLLNAHNTRSVDLIGSFGLGYVFSLSKGTKIFLQPSLSTNIPGNLLDFLGQSKGGDTGNITVYWFGINMGVML